jgi:hypothetical protein
LHFWNFEFLFFSSLPTSFPPSFLPLFLYYLFGSSGVWTQGLTLARQVLYCLSHAPNPFCFSDRTLNFCPELAWTLCLLHCWDYSCIPHICLVCWNEVSLTWFVAPWPRTIILQISAYWVAGIIDMNHHVWHKLYFKTHITQVWSHMCVFTAFRGWGRGLWAQV